MGEAGPEAILSLTRGSDGPLGARAKGNGGSGININMPLNVNIDQRGNDDS